MVAAAPQRRFTFFPYKRNLLQQSCLQTKWRRLFNVANDEQVCMKKQRNY